MFDDIVNNVVIPSAEKKSQENLKVEIQRTLEQLQIQGKVFVKKATIFSRDPLEESKRQEMIKASRQLVREVTKLLILGM